MVSKVLLLLIRQRLEARQELSERRKARSYIIWAQSRVELRSYIFIPIEWKEPHEGSE